MKFKNIMIVTLVPLRADHLSCYGYHRDTTPNIDRIAAEGTIFRARLFDGRADAAGTRFVINWPISFVSWGIWQCRLTRFCADCLRRFGTYDGYLT